jgi:hypothetical protein
VDDAGDNCENDVEAVVNAGCDDDGEGADDDVDGGGLGGVAAATACFEGAEPRTDSYIAYFSQCSKYPHDQHSYAGEPADGSSHWRWVVIRAASCLDLDCPNDGRILKWMPRRYDFKTHRFTPQL